MKNDIFAKNFDIQQSSGFDIRDIIALSHEDNLSSSRSFGLSMEQRSWQCQPNMSTHFIRFAAHITSATVNRLARELDRAQSLSKKEVVLMMHSPGGNTGAGLYLHNLLHSSSVPIRVYNMGTIDSVAVVGFCGCADRRCAPNSKFVLHPPHWEINDRLSVEMLREKLGILETERDMCRNIQIGALGTEEGRDFLDKFLSQGGGAIASQQALQIGLVNAVETPDLPQGADVVWIDD